MNARPRLDPHAGDWTLERFRAFYDARPDGEFWQLIDGTPHCMMTAPKIDHQIVEMNLLILLNDVFRRQASDLMALGRLGTVVPGNDRWQPEPDVSVIDTRTDEERYVSTALLVAEVLSPSNTRALINRKLGFYATLPLSMYSLVVEPTRYEVDLYAREEAWAKRELRGREAVLTLPAFGFEQPIGALYAGTALARAGG